ncbi:MAG: FGGY-family carbohydrate kinase [Spirochaetales bacterium]|jgi:sugar (pentulose or hexulose) kinase|nr:FGGY-family carbohydrate kinase [Spirochaetales bacterium]
MKQNSEQYQEAKKLIEDGLSILGFELGSTRIKATLITPGGTLLSSGAHDWENRLINGIWSYSLDDIWTGVAACFEELIKNIYLEYNVRLTRFAAGGFSAMMHGYLVFDEGGSLLIPFRTWRNNITKEASKELTELFAYPISQRWSIAHLYQSILNGEEHVSRISYITTLAGYVHWKLTNSKVIGIGDASGMFPVDTDLQDFDSVMLEKFDRKVKKYGFGWKLRDILPTVTTVGETAGKITPEGARMLYPHGTLKSGIPLCSPEGDAGAGMAATNSVRERTGNVSAGTSVFSMLVLEKKLKKVHPEIDLVVTPDGKLVGMAHSNNCSSDYDAWINLFSQAGKALGITAPKSEVYDKLLGLALQADADAGGLLSYGYVSGEHVTGFSEGRPLFVRKPDSAFTLPNFMRSLLFTSLCALRTGLNILFEEGVTVDEIRGHGGFFKTKGVGQRIMAAATNIPVSLLDTAGEGGSWGMALLAAYMIRSERSEKLPEFLDAVFAESISSAVQPQPEDVEGFNTFFERYHKGLPIEALAVRTLR